MPYIPIWDSIILYVFESEAGGCSDLNIRTPLTLSHSEGVFLSSSAKKKTLEQIIIELIPIVSRILAFCFYLYFFFAIQVRKLISIGVVLTVA